MRAAGTFSFLSEPCTETLSQFHLVSLSARQCVEVEERHVLTTGEILKGELKKSGGVGAYFKNERTALIRSHWQVLCATQ